MKFSAGTGPVLVRQVTVAVSVNPVITRVGNYIPTFFIDIKYNFFHFIDIIYRYKI